MSHLRAVAEQMAASDDAMERGSKLAEKGDHQAAARAFNAAASAATSLAELVKPASSLLAAKWELIAQLRGGWALQQRRASAALDHVVL